MSQRDRGKVGRNDLCPCGSGKKHKKCHGATARTVPPRDVLDALAYRRIKADLDRQIFESQFSAPKPIKATFKGSLMRAFRSHLFVRKVHETYQEWVITVLKMTMGQGWLNKYKPPNQDGHPVKRWLYSWSELGARHLPANRSGPAIGVVADGHTKALVSLSDDVYRLRQAGSFPSALRDRLRDPRQFQGVRYEIAAAATFVRAGFDVAWEERRGSSKKVEFRATQRGTKEVVAVETKSRHRPGMLGNPGDPPDPKQLHFDVQRLFAEALEQAPESGIFAVFIDLNLPRIDLEPYIGSLDAMLGEELHRADIATLIVLTNWPWHYDATSPASPGFGHFLEHQQPRFPLKDRRTADVLFRELQNYGNVPPDL
jgi:hypothetical protein